MFLTPFTCLRQSLYDLASSLYALKISGVRQLTLRTNRTSLEQTGVKNFEGSAAQFPKGYADMYSTV